VEQCQPGSRSSNLAAGQLLASVGRCGMPQHSDMRDKLGHQQRSALLGALKAGSCCVSSKLSAEHTVESAVEAAVEAALCRCSNFFSC